MEKKQTACDWLHCQLDELEKTKHERSLSLHLDLRDEIFKEAKALEKQQIVDATKPYPITIEHLMNLLLLYYSRKITEPRLIEILNEIAAGKHKNGIEL